MKVYIWKLVGYNFRSQSLFTCCDFRHLNIHIVFLSSRHFHLIPHMTYLKTFHFLIETSAKNNVCVIKIFDISSGVSNDTVSTRGVRKWTLNSKISRQVQWGGMIRKNCRLILQEKLLILGTVCTINEGIPTTVFQKQ